MSVLLCDSNCELWYERAEELRLDYISMPYYLEGEVRYYDLGKNTDFRKFYDAVRAGAIPKTQALNPEEYKEILTPYFERGEDVLYVSFSHKMSGTFQSLQIALNELKERYPDRKCTVFNTNSISAGAALQVEQAARLKSQGATDEEIVAYLTEFTNQTTLCFVVDDLMHLKRGGRLSSAAAVAGTILALKPILTTDAEGGLCVLTKISGKKKALTTLANKVIDELTDETCTVFVIDADAKEDGDRVRDLILQKRPNAKIFRQPIGPVVGSHCGPGTVGVAYASASRPIPLK